MKGDFKYIMVIKDLKRGMKGTVDIIIESAIKADARDGSIYQKLTAKDTDGKKFKLTNFNKMVNEKDILSANISCSEYEGLDTYQLMSWKPNTKLSIMDFKPKAEIDMKKAWKEVVDMLNTIDDVPCCKLACKVLTHELSYFKVAPLTASEQYSRVSGLLEATLKLMKLADSVAKVEALDRNLMIAAASVYYTGSTRMTDDNFQPTRDVALMGFDIASHDKLVAANKELALNGEAMDEERFLIFDNILLSRYQGKPTATMEAFSMKMLDSIIQVNEIGRKKLDSLEEGAFMAENSSRYWYRCHSSSSTESDSEEGDQNE